MLDTRLQLHLAQKPLHWPVPLPGGHRLSQVHRRGSWGAGGTG